MSDDNAPVLHLHGGNWSLVPGPSYSLDNVYALAPDDVWALDSLGGAYHYDGHVWRFYPLGGAGDNATFMDIFMVSPSDGWVAGYGGLWHYSGSQWTNASSLIEYSQPSSRRDGGPYLESVYMTSATDGWAVGDGVIFHYDGSHWVQIANPITGMLESSPEMADFLSVRMVSPTDGWIVGTEGKQGVILHYTGSKWVIAYSVPSSGITQLKSLAMVSATEGWAGGTEEIETPVGDNTINDTINPVMLHYADGQWTRVTSPGDDVQSIAMGSSDDGWAVVYDELLHYRHGAWTEALW